jgi:putative transposase
MMGAVHLLPGTTHSSVMAKGSHDPEVKALRTLRKFDCGFSLEICR